VSEPYRDGASAAGSRPPFGRVLGVVLIAACALLVLALNALVTFKCHPPLSERVLIGGVGSAPFVLLGMLGGWLSARGRGRERRIRRALGAAALLLGLAALTQVLIWSGTPASYC